MRGSGSPSEVRYREPRPDRRADAGYREPQPDRRPDMRYREPRPDHRADGGYREPQPDRRPDMRYREPRPDHRADGGYRESYGRNHAPAPGPQHSGRYTDRGHSGGQSRHYYTESFRRPRFVHRSGFSLGIVLGAVPSYGYRYLDPYCDLEFGNLDVYYNHSYDYGHPDVIQVLDTRSGYPIATLVYRGGNWVVDDCG